MESESLLIDEAQESDLKLA
jgi:hypothetical protein